MSWLALGLAGCFEVIGVLNLKRVAMKKGRSSIILLIVSFFFSFLLLTYAMIQIPMGTAYAVWTGIGTVGAAVLGMVVYKEPKEWRRLLCIAMILAAAIGLKLTV
ncbi:DMT family transporter [Paenibacillus sp. GCM10012307]|uniref:Multidrug efflux SMR transporter n=1 Tax=Paenibacillus roseus TaxID=2798579 RepID=A0A934J0P5_9BACL|nr:multidrug efflux SMR transporter [Paenibacillus roseus]MBJ6362686.1 multidrug efflux SMR transporter [Paenibacillus roseus]